MKYSRQRLSYIQQSINNFLSETDKASRKLVFKLRQNLKKINEADELIREDFKELSEDESRQLQEFQNKKIEIIKKHGGKLNHLKNGNIEIVNHNEVNSNEECVADLEELAVEYEEVLDKATEVDKENFEISKEDIAEVDWVEIELNLFPEEMGSEFNDAFLEFTKE